MQEQRIFKSCKPERTRRRYRNPDPASSTTLHAEASCCQLSNTNIRPIGRMIVRKSENVVIRLLRPVIEDRKARKMHIRPEEKIQEPVPTLWL